MATRCKNGVHMSLNEVRKGKEKKKQSEMILPSVLSEASSLVAEREREMWRKARKEMTEDKSKSVQKRCVEEIEKNNLKYRKKKRNGKQMYIKRPKQMEAKVGRGQKRETREERNTVCISNITSVEQRTVQV